MGGRGKERGEGMDGEERGGMGKGEIDPPTFWLLPPPMVVGARVVGGRQSRRQLTPAKLTR